MSEAQARAIAFYLPQYHPIPENDEWWGSGFTEWRNVVKAKPLFKGHYQPHLPADLGFYDLRLAEARAAQAELARAARIHGFCYYHYWFNGRRVLQRPFTEVLESGEPSLPFCLCWANENWTRRWDGLEDELLLQQTYSADDDIAHIRALLPAFHDPRYIRVDGKPMFLVYRSRKLPDARATAERWRNEAARSGLPGLFLVRVDGFLNEEGEADFAFDATVEFQPKWRLLDACRISRRKWWHRRQLNTDELVFRGHNVFSYPRLVEEAMKQPPPKELSFPCVTPAWDNSARRQKGAMILVDSTPEIYKGWLEHAVQRARAGQRGRLAAGEKPIVFINAWNEWAEGNHLEPCQKWGGQYLGATEEALVGSGD